MAGVSRATMFLGGGLGVQLLAFCARASLRTFNYFADTMRVTIIYIESSSFFSVC